MEFIDVHCHLTDEVYSDVERTLSNARNAGVNETIVCGYDAKSSEKAMRLAEKYDGIWFCAGFQPEELKDGNLAELDVISALVDHKKCVAIGEIGLDYHFDDNPPKETQKEFFVRQLEIADKKGLPVVVHSRDACADTLQILQENSALLKKGGLMHCYSYSAEILPAFANLGFYFSFGGTSTFKNARKVKESATVCPKDRILTETDCPYLSPEPFRGVFPNEPERVAYVLKNLAFLRGENETDLSEAVLKNASRLFEKLK